MIYGLSDEQLLIQETARKFASKNLVPFAEQFDQKQNQAQFKQNLITLAQDGFIGLNVSSDWAGSDAGVVAFSLAVTEIAKACASTAVTMSVSNMVAEVIESVGSIEQKESYLPKLCSGEYLAGSFCLSESGAGSDPAGMKTRATKDGGHWVINGSKMWITSAEITGVFLVWAVTDSAKPKGKGISCFLVEANHPGVTVGKVEEKMGQNGSSTNSVIFEDCRIPASAMLGKLNDGYRIAVEELAGGRIGIGSLALGIGRSAIDYATRYANQREQFGKAISAMQGPQWMIADTNTELEAAQLLLINAANLKQAGLPFNKQASMAKLYASEAANRACYTAIQLAGGIGYTKECPLERYARDARVTAIYEGTSEIQRVIIAKEILKSVSD